MTATDLPVLVLGFNRPEQVQRLIDRLRTVQPKSLYFALDGPRSNSANDAALVKKTQDLVSEFDWDCEVHTLFQIENLGCARGVTAGIDWFFSQVSEGIILEDDVVPDPSFFPFCAELLEKYRGNPKVWCISGSNRLPDSIVSDSYSYRLSAIPQVWGWATWRDRWEKYSLDIKGWRTKGLSNYKLLQSVGYSPSAFAFWSVNFDLMSKMAVDTWDIQLVNAAMRNDALAVIPNRNLVENIGWGDSATHTRELPPSIQEVNGLTFPLKHPLVLRDFKSDRTMNRIVYQATPLGLLRQFIRYRGK